VKETTKKGMEQVMEATNSGKEQELLATTTKRYNMAQVRYRYLAPRKSTGAL
jgi:hypothetical protein